MSDATKTPRIDMMRSPLGRARGSGAARSGAHHWWAQRLTAVALVPLTLWFVWSLILLTGAGQAAMVDWLSAPHRLALMLALIGATFHHLILGLQVVIEDYVRADGQRVAALLAMKGVCVLCALMCAASVLKLGL
jgi:succinate dehydrogenase / fumarate reductase membrane anchor subunit